MKRYTIVSQPAVQLISCDRCGFEASNEDMSFESIRSLKFCAGYASPLGDGNNVEIDICESCLRDVLGQWLRISNSPLDTILGDYCPRQCGDDVARAHDAKITEPREFTAQEREIPISPDVHPFRHISMFNDEVRGIGCLDDFFPDGGQQRLMMLIQTHENLLRILEIIGLAGETFESNVEVARWLCRPHQMLKGISPLVAVKSPFGAECVKEILVAVKHGGAV